MNIKEKEINLKLLWSGNMKLKALAKGNMDDTVRIKQDKVELEIPDSVVQIGQKAKTFSEAIWDTIGKFSESSIDWKKEWHKHLEEKYNG